jgi:predicted transcriptional regulator of viral defense system
MLDAYRRLLDLGQPVFRTRDAAACLRIMPAHASKVLDRLAGSGHVLPVAHGLWALPGKTQALALPERLTDPFPSYVSLQSALYHHGMISQIPAVTYAVSIGRTRVYETPLGTVSVHHVTPSFFGGFEIARESGVKMAVPEKAIVDYFYLSPTRSRLFTALPDLELPRSFRLAKARAFVRSIRSPRRRVLVESLLEKAVRRT